MCNMAFMDFYSYYVGLYWATQYSCRQWVLKPASPTGKYYKEKLWKPAEWKSVSNTWYAYNSYSNTWTKGYKKLISFKSLISLSCAYCDHNIYLIQKLNIYLVCWLQEGSVSIPNRELYRFHETWQTLCTWRHMTSLWRQNNEAHLHTYLIG